MKPPAINAAKTREVPPAAPATIAGVRKMPMPTTRLNTTIAVSKVDSRARMVFLISPVSPAMQRLLEQGRKPLELIEIIVKLRGDAQQRQGMRMEPCLDAAFAEPVVQAFAVEPVSRGTHRGRRQRYGRHRSDHRVRTGSIDSGGFEDQGTGLERQVTIDRHHLRPSGGQQAADETQRLRDAQPSRRIERSGPIEFRVESRGVAVADDIRVQLRLAVAAHVQEGGALGGAKPLMGVARVISA